MTNLDDYYRCRDDLSDYVVRDLVGPLAGDTPTDHENVLVEAPIQRYLAGILYPQSPKTVDPFDDDEQIDVKLDTPGEDNRPERAVPLSSARYPSAIGITASVDLHTQPVLEIGVSAARYQPEQPPDGEVTWRRTPLSETVQVDLQSIETTRLPVASGLELYLKARAGNRDGATAVTVALVNTLAQTGYRRDTESFFQCEFTLRTLDRPGFVDRSKLGSIGTDEDARSLALLYRKSPSFAVGHGTGVDWGDTVTTDDGGLRTDTIRATPAPHHDLRLADSNPDIVSDYFSMQRLATAGRSDVVAGLRDFVAGYRNWISHRGDEVPALPGRYHSTATRHLDECRDAADRMDGGVDYLASNDDAWLAFQLANQAMLEQRSGSRRNPSDDDGSAVPDEHEHQWRPFQLGFILMTIQGTGDPECDERSLVDLLWFPTGGGKTEAYLGLIAFTIFLRRLREVADGRTGGGLTVIMRYTLRLLTLQQFERAAALICACERLRRENAAVLGGEEISICLWVGGAATPNRLDEARHAIAEARKGRTTAEGNPIQLTQCPWCGHQLSASNYRVGGSGGGMTIACPDSGCDFASGLPCYLVDEDIYRLKPTLMIATVDKFASLPWRDSIGGLFNIDSDDRPPELIIQDELHLISGPLGTMVGLYETAIDLLCLDGDRAPKLIASTATIRRAADQVQRLYDRRSFQFPPPGIDAADSYFAVETHPAEKGTRRYLGLMAPGRSQAMLLVHSYAALLQRASEINAPPSVVDPYWTLLGYFINLRVLGAAHMQVRDAMRERTTVLAAQSNEPSRFEDASPHLRELTSRRDAFEIPEVLRKLAASVDDGDCLDVVLATNMISVGLDIDRLGLMAVAGQPQSASEYIQATSRVGRRHPGLVVVLYNAFRSRDRSHYEGFVSFHNSIYRQVDASSLTPFAARARDRALHAVLIGMLRAKYPEYRPNDGASNTSKLDIHAEWVIERIVNRIERIDPGETAMARAHLHSLVEAWKRRVEEEPELYFRHDDPERSLLTDAAHPELADECGSFSTTWSMRSVDTESNLHLIR